jgi:hypothetical protein
VRFELLNTVDRAVGSTSVPRVTIICTTDSKKRGSKVVSNDYFGQQLQVQFARAASQGQLIS